jgi:hypothetical protein
MVSTTRTYNPSSRRTKIFSLGMVPRRSRLARFFAKITKWSETPSDFWSLRIAGSARIVLPISESSINRIFRRIDVGAVLKKEHILLKSVPKKQSGTPAK